MLNIGVIRVAHEEAKARAMVARALGAEGNRRALVQAAIQLRKLRRTHAGWCEASAEALEAALAFGRHDDQAARQKLHRAHASFSSLGMRIHAAAASHRLAILDQDEVGRQSAMESIAAEGGVDPEKFFRIYLPWPSRSSDLGKPLA
jgi:hypothetical protein